MEIMKNLRGSWIRICTKKSSQGFLCSSLVLWHRHSLLVQMHRYDFGVQLKVSAKIHEEHFMRSV